MVLVMYYLSPSPMTIGQPVAWCISDREDTPVMRLFLSRVQERCPAAAVKTVMTDDGKHTVMSIVVVA